MELVAKWFRELKSKGSAFAQALAFNTQCAAHLFSDYCATVETKTVPVFFSSEPVGENSIEILG